MTISEKVAYLKGLAEGLNIDTDKSKEGKLITVIIGILEEIGMSIEDLEESSQALGQTIDALSDDLSDVENVIYADDDGETKPDDDWYETECPQCGSPILVDQDDLAVGSVTCHHCGARYVLDQDVPDEDDGSEDDADPTEP